MKASKKTYSSHLDWCRKEALALASMFVEDAESVNDATEARRLKQQGLALCMLAEKHCAEST